MSKSRLPTRPPERRPPASAEDTTNVFISWVQELARQARLAWRLLLDPRVEWWTKLIPPAVLAYILSPVDIIPDVALGFGQLDDIAILLLGIKLFIELAPTEVVREHLEALGTKISELKANEEGTASAIEGEFTVEEKETPE